MAVTPPMGPVFLSLPLDILDMENPEEVRTASRINYRCVPEDETIIAVVQAFVQAVHPVTLGICADPRLTLEKINNLLEKASIPCRKNNKKEISSKENLLRQSNAAVAVFMRELSSLLDENTIIFDESLTASGYVASFLTRTLEGTFFQTRGGSLGVGIPGGMGILLAHPNRQVIVFTGDGGSMYTIQALHTAVRYNIPVKVVICNNGRYSLLDKNLEVYRKEHGILPHQQPDCFSLEPAIDFVTLARSMGINGIKAETKEQAVEAAKMPVHSAEAFLVDLNICE